MRSTTGATPAGLHGRFGGAADSYRRSALIAGLHFHRERRPRSFIASLEGHRTQAIFRNARWSADPKGRPLAEHFDLFVSTAPGYGFLLQV